ncbi:hypothetical protein HYT26_04780 [Candidatus Pacearchaeota archaeon]|nr:hypothetical protein [Candidatus Pacearchaeota archaeon]
MKAEMNYLEVEADWHCYRNRANEEELGSFLKGDIEERVNVLKKLKPKEYIVIKEIRADQNQRILEAYLDELKEKGLEISKFGECKTKYNFIITQPKEVWQDTDRKLVIFRR